MLLSGMTNARNVLLVGLTLFACAGLVLWIWQRNTAPSGPELSPFVKSLDAHGFFKHASVSETERCRSQISKSPDTLWDCESARFFHADAEALAEGFALTFLNEEVGVFLKREDALTQPASWTEDSAHVIQIAERSYPFLTAPESDAWSEATRSTLFILNDLLERAESTERAYGLYGGEEFSVVFLTPKQFDVIRANHELDPSHHPWETEPKID